MAKRLSHKLKIVLVGDIIIDIYRHGTAVGISSEAPVEVMREDRTEIFLGGAGLVARNLLELGAHVSFASVIGDDEYASLLRDFSHKNARTFFVEEKGRSNVVKKRFLKNGQKIFRWDRTASGPVSARSTSAIFDFIKKELAGADKVLVMDARHGVMTRPFIKALIRECRRKDVPIYVDSQVARSESNHVWYKGATLVSLNQKEAASVDPSFDEGRIKESLQKIAARIGIGTVILKRGAHGSAGFVDGKFITAPPHRVKAKDAVGAGDAFFAALAVTDFPHGADDLRVANKWAARSTTIVGTRPPTRRATASKKTQIKT